MPDVVRRVLLAVLSASVLLSTGYGTVARRESGTHVQPTATPSAMATASPEASMPAPSSEVSALPRAQHATGPGVVTQRVVHGLTGAMTVSVYTPPVPAGSAPLPVVYALHGYPGDPVSMMSALAPALDQAFDGDGMAPFELVTVDGRSAAHDDTEWSDSDDGRTTVESSLLQSVIPAVEGSRPRTPAERAVLGFSMGGFGATTLALRHADVFGQVVVVAGYFVVDDLSGLWTTAASREAHDPSRIVTTGAGRAAAAGERWYLTTGLDDTEPLTSGAQDGFVPLLQAAGASVQAHTPPGGHDYDFLTGRLPSIAKFLDEGWS